MYLVYSRELVEYVHNLTQCRNIGYAIQYTKGDVVLLNMGFKCLMNT